MRKGSIFSVSIIAVALLLAIFVAPQEKAFAEVKNGIYSIDYQVLKADSDGVSIGNDYFAKPATMIVENGVTHIQLTVKSSKWVKALSGPTGAVSVVSENKAADTRAVKFKVDDISKPVTMEMHISFEMDGEGYDQVHKARFAFDKASVKAVGDKVPSKDKAETTGVTGAAKEENPKTGDNTPIAMFAFLLAASSIVLFRSMRSSK